MNRLKIFHPFGMVGHLDWLGVNPGTTRFGESDEPDLLKIAAQIRTFNERMDDEQVLASIRTEVEKAEVIVFLGFAFHQQNIDLMRPGKLCAAKRIFATAKGISQSDCAVIEQELHKLVGTDHVRIDIRDLTCTGLFDEYWRTLTRL